MKKRTSKHRNSGFTLVEVLAAVAVLAILLAVSAVGVAQYRDSLKLAELDNAAREIYMAAQNRAALLSGSQRLSSLVGKSGTGNTISGVDEASASGRFISCTDVVEGGYGDLLPTGSIDATLLKGDFYIVYEPESGSVTDVFYAEDKIAYTEEGSFQAFYNQWKAASRSERMKRSPMLGYYGGGVADVSDTSGADRLHTPTVTVLIHNEEELWVEVTFQSPAGTTSSEKKVELACGETTITLLDTSKDAYSAYSSRLRQTVNKDSTTYKWTLDSLKCDKNGKRLSFYNLVNLENGLGKDFTVTATMKVMADGKRPAEASASATDNSLFAKDSNDTTAKLMYLRHLQNLDRTFSHVSDTITQAEQLADIQCLENEVYVDYKDFQPINNTKLTSYKGNQKAIRGLYVQTTGQTTGNAGLFGAVNRMAFTGIRLVNAHVEGTTAGALVGQAGDGTTFDDCQVYWEPTDTGSYTDLLGSNADSNTYKYQIIGATAGGLAGSVGKSCTIEGSLSATLISGSATAGGLVGSAEDTLKVTNSYADCYLAGNTSAGLVGHAGSVTLTDCYAAGFIDMSGNAQAAGLCMGSGATVTADRVYSVMRPVGLTSNATFWYLTQTQEKPNSNTFNDSTYCLDLNIDPKGLTNGIVRPYDEMIDKKFITDMGSAFAKKSPVDSHPYNLREDLTLTNYDFPGLKSLPHYGDWTAEFKEPSLVYYEKYSDGSYGFSGGNARTLVNSLDNEKTIKTDGYAVAFLASDLDGKEPTDPKVQSVTLSYTDVFSHDETYYNAETGRTVIVRKVDKEATRGEWIEANGQTENDTVPKEYYLIPLPADFSTEASADFYHHLSFTFKFKFSTDTESDESEPSHYFYSPHFSETVIPIPAEDIPVDWTADTFSNYAANLIKDRQADLRTPRHLYELSKNPEYYNGGYRFQQRLDLDYSTYTEYADPDTNVHLSDQTFLQDPIGTESAPFRGTYNGGSHTISNVQFKSAEVNCVGLFGRSQGNLNNIIYHIKLDSALTVARTWNRLNLGGLVGWNDGTVSNCAASGLRLNAISNYAPFYIGGLVGYSSGTVRDCGVEAPQLSLKGTGSTSNSYMGGLVGLNSGWVGTSYAVARIDGSVDQVSSVCTGGFVGRNEGTITNSYAATHMTSSGLKAKSSGFCGESWATGVQTNTYFLNMGNLSYRGSPYAAVYSDAGAAEGKTYGELSGMNLPGMGKVGTDPADYPYPTAVRDANGQPFYPGEHWPIPLEIGAMGIYYWERLDVGNKVSYNTSLLTVDPETNTVTKHNTLSTSHDDGGIVTEYGYGYYAADAGEDARVITVKAENINYYSGDKGELFQQDREQTDAEKDVDKALKALMPGYTFHSYLSLDLDKQVGGLYPEASTKQPNGTLTLEQSGSNGEMVSVTFTLNPFFADAMSVTLPEGWNQTDSTAPTAAPGSANNVYGVRAIEQLEFINWNSVTMNTTTVLTWDKSNHGSTDNFPYLSKSNDTGKYYWTQSHDIVGEKDENGVYKTYTPIAEYYDGTSGDQGNLDGWFGGTYNGQDYVIENVNIQGQKSSCAGLFGVVYNGKLSNIILYSSDGAGKISTTVNQTKSKSAWYAMGALAGVVGANHENTVDNCSVAGYTIDATVYTGNGWGGNNIGGLIGEANLNLSNCTAVTTVYVHDATENDNMRVGGLVGSCHGTISNCYAGGEIKFDNNTIKQETGKPRYIYVGGLVAGSYMKPLAVSGSMDFIGVNPRDNDARDKTSNTLINCYSYMVLPRQNAAGYRYQSKNGEYKIRALYAVGGAGEITETGDIDIYYDYSGVVAENHGICTRTNCYYLESVVLTNNPGGLKASSTLKTDVDRDFDVYKSKRDDEKYAARYDLTPLTYEQLAGEADIKGTQRIDKLLPNFQRVTTQLPLPGGGTYAVPGMYSYPPSSQSDLQGLDYPFPTILTRNDAEGTRNVHYGRWPLNGITREQGNKPIELDLFVGGGTLEETLMLADAKPGGTWNVSIGDIEGKGQIAKVETQTPSEDKSKLTIKLAAIAPNAEQGAIIDLSAVGGTTRLHVTYQDPEGRTYTHDYTLRVTAELKLKPAQVALFPKESITLTPTVTNRVDDALENGVLELTGVQKSTGSVTAAPANYGQGGVGTFTGVTLTGGETATTTPEIVGVNYRFTYGGKTYAAAGSILAEVLPVNTVVTPELGENGEQTGIYTVEFDFGGRKDVTNFKADLAPDQNDAALQMAEDGTASVRLALYGTSFASQEPDALTDTPADGPEPDTLADALADAPADNQEPETPPDSPVADQTGPDQATEPDPLADDTLESGQAAEPAPLAEPPADGQTKPVTLWEVTLNLSFDLGGQPHAFAVTVTIPLEQEPDGAQPAEDEAARPAGENELTLTTDADGQSQELEGTATVPPTQEETDPDNPEETNPADTEETNPDNPEEANPATPDAADPSALPPEADPAALLPTPEEAEPADGEQKPDGEEEQDP